MRVPAAAVGLAAPPPDRGVFEAERDRLESEFDSALTYRRHQVPELRRRLHQVQAVLDALPDPAALAPLGRRP